MFHICKYGNSLFSIYVICKLFEFKFCIHSEQMSQTYSFALVLLFSFAMSYLFSLSLYYDFRLYMVLIQLILC